jgi:autotransporter-associated beta strand protein
LPANDGTATATFGTASTTAITLDASWSLSGLVFNSSGATNYGFTTTDSSTLTLGSGGISVGSNATVSFSNGIVLGATTVPVVNAGALTLSGVVSGSGGITVSGGSEVSLTGTANTFTGSTTLSAGGILMIAGDRSLGAVPGSATPGSITLSGGTLMIGGSTSLSTNRGIAVTANSTIDLPSSGTVSYGGILSGSADLTIGGSGSASLSLTSSADTYSGTLTIANGSSLTTTSLSNATVNVNGGLTLANNITLGGLTGTGTVAGPAAGTAAKILTIGANSSTTTFAGVISDGTSSKLSVTKTGTGTLTLSGNSTYTGTTTASGGTLSVSGSLSGGGTASVTNNGTLLLTGSLSGAVTIGNGGNGGLMLIDDGGTLATGKNVTVNSSGTLVFNRSDAYTVSNTILGGGQLTQAGSDIVTLTGTNSFNGVISLNAGELSVGTISPIVPFGMNPAPSNLGGSSNVASNLIFNGGALQYTGLSTSTDHAFTVVSGAAIFDITTNNLTLVGINNSFETGTGLTKLGAGTLTLGDGVTDPNYGYTGATTVSGGTLVVNGSIAASSGVALASGTSLAGTGTVSGVTLAGSNTLSSAGILTTAGITVSGTGNTLSSGTVAGNTTVGSGAAFAIATGATLTGTATSAGLLTNNGTISGTVEIQNAGTLKGSGTFNGAVTIDSGGTLSPGNSPGLATFSSSLTLNGATQMEINGTSRGTTYDAVNVAGALTYGGTLNLAFGSTVMAGQTYNLFNAANGTSPPAATGDFSSISLSGSGYSGTLSDSSGIWTGTDNGLEFTFTDSTGALTTSLSAVPEPSTYPLIFGGLALGAAFYRRRRALTSG